MDDFWNEINELESPVKQVLTLLRTRKLDNSEIEKFQKLGLNLDLIRKNDSKFLLTQTGLTRNLVPEDDKAKSRKIHFANWAVKMYSNCLKDRSFLSVCPQSGLIKNSQCSIPFGNNFTRKNLRMCAYRFKSDFVYYIITGQLWGEKIGMYIPKLECFIQLGNRNISTGNLLPLLTKWKQFLSQNKTLVRSYIESSEKESVLVMSYPTNIYHYLCNGMSSLDHLDQLNVLGYISKVFVNSYNFFGSVENYFPNLRSKVFKSKSKDFDIEILENNYFAISPSHIKLRLDFIKKIKDFSIRNISSIELDRRNSVREESDLTVLIYIKVNRRQWIGQDEGLANILLRLKKKYEKISVVFFGFTFPSEINEQEHENLKAYFSEMIDAEKQIVKNIWSKIGDMSGFTILDLIGEKMEKVIAWSEIGDFYISPGGVGLVPIVLISNKPGVFHSNTAVNEIPLKNRPYCFERSDINIPEFLPQEDITDVRTKESEGSSHADSYYCNWESIYQIIEDKLAF